MISVPGIGSGLDINSIVNGLVSAEGDARTLLLANRQATIESEISAFGSVRSTLSTFQASASTLSLSSTFSATRVTSSNTEFFTATGGSGLPAGSYDIEIRQLAQSQRLLSPGFADSNTNVGTGTLSISVGSNSFNVAINSENQTLSGIRNAINNATDNTGVNATIISVDDGSGGTESKLILTANGTGSDNTITINVTDDDSNNVDQSGLSALYYDTTDGTAPEQMEQINAAVDAELFIDGQRILSSTNTVQNVIEGVTLTLNRAEAGTVNQLSIGRDNDSILNSIRGFINNYNTYITLNNELTFFDPENQSSGDLNGDVTLRTLTNSIRSTISQSVPSSSTDSIQTLVELGITTNPDGLLIIDNAALNDALTTSPDQVEQLFASPNGIASNINNLLLEYTRPLGLIDNKTSGLNRTIEGIQSDLQDLNLSLERLETRLLSQFSSLDIIVTQLNSTSSFLTQQFEQLSNILNQSRS